MIRIDCIQAVAQVAFPPRVPPSPSAIEVEHIVLESMLSRLILAALIAGSTGARCFISIGADLPADFISHVKYWADDADKIGDRGMNILVKVSPKY